MKHIKILGFVGLLIGCSSKNSDFSWREEYIDFYDVPTLGRITSIHDVDHESYFVVDSQTFKTIF